MMPDFIFVTFFGACYIASNGVETDVLSSVGTDDKSKKQTGDIVSEKVSLGVKVTEKEILHTKFSVVNIIFTELRELINFIKIELSCSVLKKLSGMICADAIVKLRKVIA